MKNKAGPFFWSYLGYKNALASSLTIVRPHPVLAVLANVCIFFLV